MARTACWMLASLPWLPWRPAGGTLRGVPVHPPAAAADRRQFATGTPAPGAHQLPKRALGFCRFHALSLALAVPALSGAVEVAAVRSSVGQRPASVARSSIDQLTT